MPDDKFLFERILDRIDKFDNKFDSKIEDLGKDITQCKLDIQGVQSDLTNHLENKKEKDIESKRKFYYITAFLGVMFTAYATMKELL